MDWSIGVDLGGTHVTAAIVDANGKIGDRFKRVLTSHAVSDVVDAVAEVFEKARSAVGNKKLAGIGIGSPGNIDADTGTVRFSPNFAWHDVPLRQLLQEKFGCDIHLLNDARCATLGEYLYGSGKGTTEFALITLGTGIGGGLVSGRRLILGSQMAAGEVGHHTIRPETGFICTCGKTGCFEVQASATGLVRHAVALAASFPRSRLLASQASDQWGTQLIVNAMLDGDLHAAAAWQRYLGDLAIGVSNIISFTNPEVIAVGGGGGDVAEEILVKPLRVLVDKRTTMAPRGKTAIVPALLGNDAGAVGAASIARLGGIQALAKPINIP